MKRLDRIRKLKRELIELKKELLTYKTGVEVETKIPTYKKNKEKIKVLTLYK